MRKLRLVLTLVALATAPGAFASTPSIDDCEPDAPAPRLRLDGGPRVRPADDRSRAVLEDGLRRSETIRALIARLEQLDVIAYVGMQHRLRGHLAGSLVWVTSAGRFRYVRVSLNPDVGTESLVAVLAHELQHVVEVAEAPSVVDPRSLSALYRRIGTERLSQTEAFDTEAAKLVGEQVRRELGSAASSRGTEVGQLGR